MLEGVDVLVANEHELASMAAGASDLPQALAAVAALGPRQVVVTLGTQGVQAWDAGRIVALPARSVAVVDSTGAGDTFVGALAASLAAGIGFEPSLARANAAAALACTRLGAREGMPTQARLDDWLGHPEEAPR